MKARINIQLRVSSDQWGRACWNISHTDNARVISAMSKLAKNANRCHYHRLLLPLKCPCHILFTQACWRGSAGFFFLLRAIAERSSETLPRVSGFHGEMGSKIETRNRWYSHKSFHNDIYDADLASVPVSNDCLIADVAISDGLVTGLPAFIGNLYLVLFVTMKQHSITSIIISTCGLPAGKNREQNHWSLIWFNIAGTTKIPAKIHQSQKVQLLQGAS